MPKALGFSELINRFPHSRKSQTLGSLALRTVLTPKRLVMVVRIMF